MKNIIIVVLVVLCPLLIHAQAPAGLQYQAVIRDGNGAPLLNTSVQFKFTIENNAGNPTYYSERQAISTNALGGINTVIGNGTVISGSFTSIPWQTGTVLIRVELDPSGGQNFSPFGTTSFQSVPYSLFAQQAKNLVDENGNIWTPIDDRDEQILSVNGNQLAISNGNVVTLPTGSGGGDNWGDQAVETNTTLAGDGTLTSPLKLAPQGATNGDVLKWNGNTWTAQDDNNTTYSAGSGISINGSTISNTGDNDNNASNEIQSLSINGNALSLTNGGTVNLPVTNYVAGTGITIAANTISAQSTTALWNANQLKGFNISAQTPVVGNYLQYSAGAWTPVVGPNVFWLANANGINYNSKVGIGIATPLAQLHISGSGPNFQIEDETINKYGSNSFEFSGHLIPAVDNARSLGLSTRRWTEVWAFDGTINTSDAREKTNIKNLNYGLDELMKLRPVSFNWIARPESGTKLGLIAQEVEAIMPEVVANPQRTPSLNHEEGEKSDRLGVYYSDLIPVLIKSIQEQQLQIEHLQEEIALLKK